MLEPKGRGPSQKHSQEEEARRKELNTRQYRCPCQHLGWGAGGSEVRDHPLYMVGQPGIHETVSQIERRLHCTVLGNKGLRDWHLVCGEVRQE